MLSQWWVCWPQGAVSFQTSSLNSYGPFPKLILLPFFPLIGLFLQTSLWIGGPAPNRLADPVPSAPLGPPSLIWKSWLSPSPGRYLHPASLWNLTGRRGFAVILRASASFEVATQKMNNFPLLLRAHRGDWGIFSRLPVCGCKLSPMCSENWTFAANPETQWRRSTPIGVSPELPADFLQFVVFPAAVTSPPFESHTNTWSNHAYRQPLNLWGGNIHIH